MTQKDKQLLLQDLCARLPYGVFVEYDYGDGVKRVTKFHGNYFYLIMLDKLQWKDFKPFLRPMSSMTEEERNEYLSTKMQETERVALAEIYRPEAISEIIDWLNTHHFDYRGLIKKGLAIEAPIDMYNIKQ